MSQVSAEIQTLRAELETERRLRERLSLSIQELQLLVQELELSGAQEQEDTENSWRDRYKAQLATNRRLQSQRDSLEQQVYEMKRLAAQRTEDRVSNIKQIHQDKVTRQQVRILERRKRVLEGQLRGAEWQLDKQAKEHQEIKALQRYHLQAHGFYSGALEDDDTSAKSPASHRTPRTGRRQVLAVTSNSELLSLSPDGSVDQHRSNQLPVKQQNGQAPRTSKHNSPVNTANRFTLPALQPQRETTRSDRFPLQTNRRSTEPARTLQRHNNKNVNWAAAADSHTQQSDRRTNLPRI